MKSKRANSQENEMSEDGPRAPEHDKENKTHKIESEEEY